MTTPYQLITPGSRPDYRELISPIAGEAWPQLMLQDPIANRHWGDLFSRFPQYQFALVDADGDAPVAIGNSVPLAWAGDLADLPEEGWDWALETAVADHAARRRPAIQCAIQIAIRPAYQGQGISAIMVQAMKAIGAEQGFERLIAPVRPSLKGLYPLTNIDRYVTWQRADGLPFDPWLRVHARVGATIVKVCHRAMRITGSITQWESWTGMRFPESGPYVVNGALNPVAIDREADMGVYVEPNVWMVHEISSSQGIASDRSDARRGRASGRLQDPPADRP